MKITDTDAGTREVRKHAATIHITGNLTLVERKLVNVLLMNAYDSLRSKKKHEIPVSFLSAIVWRDSHNDAQVKEALQRLTTTGVTFDRLKNTGKPRRAWTATQLLGEATLVDGMCIYAYSDVLAENLANPDVYAIINMGIQRKFTSAYGLALYENCLRFKGVKSTGDIPVETWRELLGATADMYDEFRHFNAFVIKKSVAEINRHSNILITPHYTRRARKVTTIRFDVAENPQLNIEEDDDEARIRESALFASLREHGISDRLAVNWIQTDPERAEATARYVTDRVAKGSIKSSRAGYTMAIWEKGEAIDVSYSESAKPKPQAPMLADDSDADQRARATQSAVTSLTPDERAALAAEFIASSAPGTLYDPAKDKVGDMVTTRKYRDFTRSRAADVIAKRA